MRRVCEQTRRELRSGGSPALAERQHGVVARRQLARAGRERGGDRRAAADAGACIGCTAGVYAVGPPGAHSARRGGWRRCSPAGRAPCSATGRRRRSGAFGAAASGAIEVTVAAARAAPAGAIRRHFARPPGRRGDDRATGSRSRPCRGRSSTSPRSPRPTSVESALREAEYLRLLRPALAAGPARSLSRAPRRARGAGAASSAARRRPAAASAAGSRSAFLPFLRRTGLPRPQLNAWLEVGRRVATRSTASGRAER